MVIKAGRSVHTPHVAGTHVGPFVLDRFLGGGADTAVWRAVGDGIVVALKLVRDRSDSVAVARLAHEALALDLVRHPSVVHRFDADDSDGESWLATALLDAGTLAQRLNDGLLDAGEAAASLAPIAEALAAAHDVGVVHRDVNPANVVLGADGPVLIDFGHAAIGGHTWDGWTATGARALARTQGFAAPESDVSPALDVYSIGVTLLEAVTGRRTLDGVATVASPGTESDLVALAAECCAADPSRRPPMLGVATRLREIAQDRPAPCQPVPPPVVDVISAEYAEHDEATDRGGRRVELDRLALVVRRALDNDELAAALVVAPAGAGKSWLLDRALDAAHRELDLGTRRTRCTTDVGDLRVLRPIVEPDIEDPRIGVAAAAVLRGAIGTHGTSTEASPRDVAEAVVAVLRLRPMAVLVDDLHWADPELIEVLSRLAFRRETPGVLLLGTRPGFVDPDDLDVETLALGPLDDHSLRATLGEIGDADLVTAATRLSGGNPLHAREAALALAAGVELDESADLRAVVAARLAAVDTSLSPALALAAASGDGFWPEIFGDELRAHVPRMVRAGYARPRLRSSVEGSTEFEWAHPLLREVAYEGLGPDQRRNLHSQLAQRLDTHPDIDPETIARHAGIAYRLGEHTLAALTARSAAASVREALDHYAVNRAADWADLLHETEQQPDLADILTAEVKNRQGDFTSALDLLLPHIERDDDIATRALTIGTETLVGLAHYEQAVQWGTRAKNQLGPHEAVRHSQSLGTALRECGRFEQAMHELDLAAEKADEAGDLILSVRLRAEAATNAAMLQVRGTGSAAHIARAREVASQLSELDDRRGLIAFAGSIAADAIALEDPPLALRLQSDAARAAEHAGDDAMRARALRRLLEVGWDADDPVTVARCSAILTSPALPATEQLEHEIVAEMASLSLDVATRSDSVRRLSALALELSRTTRVATNVQHMALMAFIYEGRRAEALRFAEAVRGVVEIPQLFDVFLRLHISILDGPPFTTPDVPRNTHAFDNEMAALAALRGDRQESDRLLRARHRFLASTGNTHQVYAPSFGGALFRTLGPSDSAPHVNWFLGQLESPSFPGLWKLQRALVALILAERGGEHRERLFASLARIRGTLTPDPEVAIWFDKRVSRLA